MSQVTFEGRIKRVWTSTSGTRYCMIYDTAENQFRNQAFHLADDMVKVAKEMSKVPQRVCLITYSNKKGKIIRIEPLK
jgi:hypothetical protein